jgi:hypothetical protein
MIRPGVRTNFNAGHDHSVIGRETTVDAGHNHAIPVGSNWTTFNGEPPHRHRIMTGSPTGETSRSGPAPPKY